MCDSAMRFISTEILKENYESYENLKKDIVRIVFKKRILDVTRHDFDTA